MKSLEEDGDSLDVFPSPRDPEESLSSPEFIDIQLPSSQNETPSKSTKQEADVDQRTPDQAAAPPGTDDEDGEEFRGFDVTEEVPLSGPENVFGDVQEPPINENTVPLVQDRHVRTPGRPRIERTGHRGRSRKLLQTKTREAEDENHNDGLDHAEEDDEIAGNVEQTFLSEVPIREAMASSDADDWLLLRSSHRSSGTSSSPTAFSSAGKLD